jgi:RNA polymerase sigma-70 factor, ECF subfamily
MEGIALVSWGLQIANICRTYSHISRSNARRASAQIAASLELSEHIPALSGDPESLAIMLDRRTKLTSAVRCLPLTYRQTAMLTLEGLTPREIADVLGITTNAVAIRMSRAKELLRRLMGDKP